MKKIILKSKRDVSLKRFHPWFFSGAVAIKDDDLKDGDLVEVYSSRDAYLATGHYQDSSIQVRVVSFEATEADYSFWLKKVRTAFQFRQQNQLPSTDTNCYRLIHAEGDFCSGLIVDAYNEVAVIQCHSVGMHL